jgi:shikimate dehydrogenase
MTSVARTGMPRQGAAVLGAPIAHSLSPVLHRAAYEALGLGGWAYRAIECREDDLGATLQQLDTDGLAGVSLTMPLKAVVMPMLAEADRPASDVGAANTVLFGDADGRWRGANTDVPGMVAVLRAAGSEVDVVAEVPPWVLGAGATAGSALAALAELGHATAVVVARRPEAADDLRAVAGRVGLDIEVRSWATIADVSSAALVIATTPAGATDQLALALPAVAGLLFDVVYSPWPTNLARAWSAAGGRTVGGLELLVEQAVEQVRLMTGHTPPAGLMRQAGYAALRSR